MSFPSPRWATPRRRDRPTYGGQVAKIGRAFGQPLMPWQRHVADVALEVDPATGHLAYGLVVVTVQRQAGKTSLLRPVLLRPVLTRVDGAAWHTAQRLNNARRTWLKTARAVERSPLAGAFTVRRTNGSETISFGPTGGELRPFAPLEESLHGETTHVVAVDEGWVFSAEQGEMLVQAIGPTQITVPDAQIWITSTAGTARSEWLRSLVDAARAALQVGDDPGCAFFDWGVPDGADLSDLQVYADHHPAYGHTIGMSSLVKARKEMPNLAAFSRAYGNRWTDAAEFIIDPVLWERGRTVEPLQRSPLALAVEVSTDGDRTVIAAGGLLAGGQAAAEIAEIRPGTAGAAARLVELAERFSAVAVVVDPHSPARGIHRELTEPSRRRRRGLALKVIDAGDYCEAWSTFCEGLDDGTVMHRSHAELDKACEVAGTRTVREQQVLARPGAAELAAAMLAVFGVRHPPRVLRPQLETRVPERLQSAG